MSAVFAIYMSVITGFSAFNVFTHIDKNWEQKGVWQSHLSLGGGQSSAGTTISGITQSEGFSGLSFEQSIYFGIAGRRLLIGPTLSSSWSTVQGGALRQDWMGPTFRFGLKAAADDGVFLFSRIGLVQDVVAQSMEVSGINRTVSVLIGTSLGVGGGVGVSFKKGSTTAWDFTLGVQSRGFNGVLLTSLNAAFGIIF